MSATGLEQLDRSLQSASIWLGEIEGRLKISRRDAWHVLGAFLHTLRDRLSTAQTAHLGGQLPLIIRGYFFEQWHPGAVATVKTREEFLEHIKQRLKNAKVDVDAVAASKALFAVLERHPKGEIQKIIKTLPPAIRALAIVEADTLTLSSQDSATTESPFAWE